MDKLAPKDLLLMNSTEYFHGLLRGAMEELKLEATEHTQFYLVGLLSHFISADNLFSRNAEGKLEDPTLVLKLAEAMSAESAEARRERLREIGDVSLYLAGYFSHSLERKLVDIDYYIEMGGAAYTEAAQIPGKTAKKEIFVELGSKFPAFVDVLGQVSEESFINQNSGPDSDSLLRVYDLWSKTGSERLARQLERAGIPVEDIRKKGRQ
jgi:hypothetical protein